MTIEARKNAFTSEAEAVAIIRAAQFWPMTFDIAAGVLTDHWHEFGAIVCVLDGEITITLSKTSESCIVKAGTQIFIEAGTLHNERTDGCRVAFGFGVDPATLTHPINKPPQLTVGDVRYIAPRPNVLSRASGWNPSIQGSTPRREQVPALADA